MDGRENDRRSKTDDLPPFVEPNTRSGSLTSFRIRVTNAAGIRRNIGIEILHSISVSITFYLIVSLVAD